MQETSNIIEDTFSAFNICKDRIFEEINKGTAWHSMAQHYGAVLRHGITAKHYGSIGTFIFYNRAGIHGPLDENSVRCLKKVIMLQDS